MSEASAQLARDPATSGQAVEDLAKGRSPMAYLLHALNQPLTGLQCSLELALAGPRRPEQYVRTLSESLELTQRMRTLVGALRELADLEEAAETKPEAFSLGTLLGQTIDDLRPVAEARGMRIALHCETELPVRCRGRLRELLFCFLESALSLARKGSELRATARADRDFAVVEVSWEEGAPPLHSPFSQAELGMLVAQAEWKRSGGEWRVGRAGTRQTCTLRMALAAKTSQSADRAPETSA